MIFERPSKRVVEFDRSRSSPTEKKKKEKKEETRKRRKEGAEREKHRIIAIVRVTSAEDDHRFSRAKRGVLGGHLSTSPSRQNDYGVTNESTLRHGLVQEEGIEVAVEGEGS